MSPLIITGIVVGLLALGLGLLVWYRGRGGEPMYGATGAAAVGDAVLLVERRGTRASNIARLRLVGANGTTRASADDVRGAVRVVGAEASGVWIQDASGLSLRDARTLSAVATPDLSGGDVVGFSPGEGPVVHGRDDRYYTVTARGLTPREGSDGFVRASTRMPGAAATIGTRDVPRLADGRRLTLRELDLIEARVVLTDAGDGPTLFDSPVSYLVVSRDARGPASNERLSRVTPEGEVLWTADASQMVGPHGLSGQPRFSVVWAQVQGGRVRVVAQATIGGRTESGGWVENTTSIAELDSQSGAVRGARPIPPP